MYLLERVPQVRRILFNELGLVFAQVLALIRVREGHGRFLLGVLGPPLLPRGHPCGRILHRLNT
jgi:hypothetical protein